MGIKRRPKTHRPKTPQLSKARLDELIEKALVDAYGESEQATAFYTMMENALRLPFETQILGVTASVESIDITDDDQLVAVCRNGGGPATDLTFGIAASVTPSRGGRVDLGISVLANRQLVMIVKTPKLRKDAQAAIDRVWPEGIIELSFDSDESYFREVRPKLSEAFHRLRNGRLIL